MSGSAIPTAQPTDASVLARLARTAVVIVTYRSEATIRAALEALPLDALGVTVVVDNCSDDGTSTCVSGYDVTLIENATNAGFGAACNLATAWLDAHAAEVDTVLFLNPDATIDATNLATLVGYLDAHPTCALVGPRLFRDGDALTSAGRTATVLTELRLVAPAAVARRLPQRRHPAAYAVTGPVGYVEGACFLVRRSALADAGGFDPRYFLFYEELDLANRLRARGWTVDLCATASASHLVAHSRSSISDNARSHLFVSAQRYLARWHGAPAAAAFAALHRMTRRRRGR